MSKVATEQQERDQAVGREVILEQELRAERRRRIDMEAQVTLADSWKAVSNGEVMIDGFLYGLMMNSIELWCFIVSLGFQWHFTVCSSYLYICS